MDCEDRSEKQLLWNMDGAGKLRVFSEKCCELRLSRRKMVRTRHSFVCCVMAAMSSSIELEKRVCAPQHVSEEFFRQGDYAMAAIKDNGLTTLER